MLISSGIASSLVVLCPMLSAWRYSILSTLCSHQQSISILKSMSSMSPTDKHALLFAHIYVQFSLYSCSCFHNMPGLLVLLQHLPGNPWSGCCLLTPDYHVRTCFLLQTITSSQDHIVTSTLPPLPSFLCLPCWLFSPHDHTCACC